MEKITSHEKSSSLVLILYNVREAYSYNTPPSLPLVRQSTPPPTSETPTTSRNLLLHLTPATVLQQTPSARPSALPCEPSPPHFPNWHHVCRAKTKHAHFLAVFNMQRAWPGLLAVSVGGVAAWAAFLSYAANQERVSSSAMRRVLSELHESEDVRDILGDAVRPEPMWYLNGSPWVHGTVRVALYASSHRRGRGKPLTILIFAPARSRCCRGTSTSASGSKVTRVRPLETFTHPSCFANPIRSPWEGAGTVYFTSIRRARGEPFTTCAYQIPLRFLSTSLHAPILWPE